MRQEIEQDLVLEIGKKLEHNLSYYHYLLTQSGLKLELFVKKRKGINIL